MNKKFSTFAAMTALAMGSLFTANAESLSEAIPGKYYQLKVTADWHGSQTAPSANSPVGKYVNSALKLEDAVESPDLWKVETKTVNGTTLYKLVNAKGETLNLLGNDHVWFKEDVAGNGDEKGFELKAEKDGATVGTVYAYGGALQSNTTEKSGSDFYVVRFDLVNTSHQNWKVSELNKFLTNGFGLQICKQIISNGEVDYSKAPVEYADLQGNPFVGVLYAEGKDNDTEFALRQGNAEGKRIVLTSDTWGSQTVGQTVSGYKFKAVTNTEYNALNKAGKIISEKFSIKAPFNKAEEPLEVVCKIKNVEYELVVSITENDAQDGNIYRLTVAKADESGKYVKDEAGYTYYVGKKNEEPQNTWVRFGLSNLIDYTQFFDMLWNIKYTDEDGKSFAMTPDCDADENTVPVNQVANDQPEGQWLYIGNATFQNRESGKTLSIENLRSTSKENVYELTDGSTYTITPAGTPGSTFSGYLNGFTADQLKQKAFFFGTPIASTGDTVYMTKGADNQIAWTTDKSAAVELRLTKVTNDEGYDLIRHFTEYLGLNDKDQVVTKVDTLNFYRYNIAEVATDQILGYDLTNRRYELKDANKWYEEEGNSAYKGFLSMVLKNKSVDTYNMVVFENSQATIHKDDTYTIGGNEYKANDSFLMEDDDFCSADKLYGAHNTNTLVAAEYIYHFTENDLFTITDAVADIYRPVAALDTIKVFRNTDNSYLLYEKENFLGLENIMDPAYAKKNGAMLADTAAGYGTWRPQYLLAVGAEIVNDGWTCPYNPEHNTPEWRKENGGHCADAVQDRAFVSGRYLVNLVDSAKAYDETGKKNNPFIHEYYQNNQPYYRLAFVDAIHRGDSLIIASTNDTINLVDNNVDKVATFAFRYVDANRDAFTIETLYKNVFAEKDGQSWNGKVWNKGDLLYAQRGYIKYHNGVPVVTPKASEAEVFDLESLTGVIPTANETIADATEAVKVIAETVLTSDNATIAVPAGIVAVKVEGEAAAKVVVK